MEHHAPQIYFMNNKVVIPGMPSSAEVIMVNRLSDSVTPVTPASALMIPTPNSPVMELFKMDFIAFPLKINISAKATTAATIIKINPFLK